MRDCVVIDFIYVRQKKKDGWSKMFRETLIKIGQGVLTDRPGRVRKGGAEGQLATVTLQRPTT